MIEHDQRLPLDLTHPVHRRRLRSHLDQNGRLELREAPADGAHGWIGRAHEVWVSLRNTEPTPHAEVSGSCPGRRRRTGAAAPSRRRQRAVRPAARPPRPLRRDPDPSPARPTHGARRRLPMWWFTRHRETARPDADQYLDLVLHLRARHLRSGGRARSTTGPVHLHRTGLAAGLTLADYRPQTGRFGHGDAMDAAHRVFAADSAAALAQIRFTDQTDTVTPQALAAASALDLAPAPRPLRDTRHGLARPTAATDHRPPGPPPAQPGVRPHLPRRPRHLGVLPGGDAVTRAWQARAAALDAYQLHLAGADPLRAARSLLHQHHVRALGVDPTAEALTLRLARTAALRQQKAVR